MRRLLSGLLAILAFIPGAARAEWMEASSDHFVIYADQSAGAIHQFATQLESYHAAMALMGARDTQSPSPSSRLTVYVVSSESELRKQYAERYGQKNRYVRGFYLPRASGSIAIVPRVRAGGRDLDFSMVALLHEYAHHFLISRYPTVMPCWYSEGSAEYFASASFYSDGSVGIGEAAKHRAGELFLGKDVSAEQLLDDDAYMAQKWKGYDAYYGKAWLLFHYLQNEPARKGQSEKYFKLMLDGKSSREAALEAYGDFGELEKDLGKYLMRRRIMTFKFPPAMLKVGQIQVRPLSAGEAAIMPLVIRTRRGVNAEQAAALVEEARKIAALYPSEPAVLAELAEAEVDAGNYDAGIAAADRALALDPRRVNAYVQKGYALFRQARDADDREAAFTKARAPFIALNRIENDHPLPLVYYYRSYVEQGKEPTELAINALSRAVELAPFDNGLRMTLALQRLRDKDRESAEAHLKILAANPHGRSLSQFAQAILDKMKAEPGWDGTNVEALRPQNAEGEEEEEEDE